MKILKITGDNHKRGSEDYYIQSVKEIKGEGREINTPSLLFNLLRLRKITREIGFDYTFPLSFDPLMDKNDLGTQFPVIL